MQSSSDESRSNGRRHCPRCGQPSLKMAARVSRPEGGQVGFFECTNCGRISGHDMQPAPPRFRDAQQ